MVFVAGCGEPPQIEEYTVPKSPRAEQPGFQHPPMMGQPRPQPAPAGQSGGPSYDVPKEWKKVTNKQFSLATFQIANSGREAFVTISPLNLLTAEFLLPSLNRWRRQVGLPDLAPGDPLDPMQDITAGNLKGQYLKLAGDESAPKRQAMLVAWLDHAGRTWYFKLSGDAELVLREEPRFKSFVQSVRFSQKEAAGDE